MNTPTTAAHEYLHQRADYSYYWSGPAPVGRRTFRTIARRIGPAESLRLLYDLAIAGTLTATPRLFAEVLANAPRPYFCLEPVELAALLTLVYEGGGDDTGRVELVQIRSAGRAEVTGP